LYWVVVRDANTTELVNNRPFVDSRDAHMYEAELEEAPDPPGRPCKVSCPKETY
jgi:hypothetical protein